MDIKQVAELARQIEDLETQITTVKDNGIQIDSELMPDLHVTINTVGVHGQVCEILIAHLSDLHARAVSKLRELTEC